MSELIHVHHLSDMIQPPVNELNQITWQRQFLLMLHISDEDIDLVLYIYSHVLCLHGLRRPSDLLGPSSFGHWILLRVRWHISVWMAVCPSLACGCCLKLWWWCAPLAPHRGCWNRDMPVPWKESWAVVELGLWSILWTAAWVKSSLELWRAHGFLHLKLMTEIVTQTWRYSSHHHKRCIVLVQTGHPPSFLRVLLWISTPRYSGRGVSLACA